MGAFVSNDAMQSFFAEIHSMVLLQQRKNPWQKSIIPHGIQAHLLLRNDRLHDWIHSQLCKLYSFPILN